MDRPASDAIRCTVIGAEKLPAAIGGPDAVCAAIEKAIAAVPGSGRASVAVTIKNASAAAAAATLADGRTLPAQNIAVSDSVLSQRSIAMLAKALADQVASAR